MDLEGKWVLVTGASRGLGREIAKKFSSEKANLIITARSSGELEKLKKEIEKSGSECKIVSGDISEDETINKLGKTAKETGLHILVNNAGIFSCGPASETKDEEMIKMFKVNTFAPMKLIRKLLPILKKSAPSQIVNIASNAALNGRKNFSLYCSTKFALRGYTDSLRQEMNRFDVKILGVYPGGIRTHLFDKYSDYDMRGFMDPSDVAKMIIEACKLPNSASVDELVINRTNK